MENVNGPILSAVVIFAAAIVTGVRRAFLAPENLRKSFREDRERTKAAIEADHVIPELASLIADVAETVGPASIADGERIQASLQSVDYLPRLTNLSEWYGDHSDCDGLIDDAQRWARRRGFSLLVLLLGVLALGAFWSFRLGFPTWLTAAGWLLVAVGGTLAGVGWWQEINDRSRLVDIFNRYG